MRTCPSCQKQVDDSMTFCPDCGARVALLGGTTNPVATQQTGIKKCPKCKNMNRVVIGTQTWCSTCGTDLTHIRTLGKTETVGETMSVLGKAITQITCGVIMLIIIAVVIYACATAH